MRTAPRGAVVMGSRLLKRPETVGASRYLFVPSLVAI